LSIVSPISAGYDYNVGCSPSEKNLSGDEHLKAVILAGGLGTRISEETHLKPKPMIEIGGKPILWHIMKIYSAYGINDFVICCGYKGYIIKEYFANYFLHMSDVTFDIKHNKMEVHHRYAEPWKVTLVDTGDETMTGGRLKRVAKYIKDEEVFCLTYGDGVSDVNITELIAFHKAQKVKATLTAAIPPGRFGALDMTGNKVNSFREKPKGDGGMINGGFFVLSPQVIDYITDDKTLWERDLLERLAEEGELAAFQHYGFWQPMDTLRDMTHLEELWQSGHAPWKVWQ
jgi:glucose-1-phosphate cytidylyltransferase